MLVHGAGRMPNIEGLNLITGNIEHSDCRGIKVNEYLQVFQIHLYMQQAGCCRDSGGLPLTPVASYEGVIVANNLINENTLKSNYAGLPSVVFTIPSNLSMYARKRSKQRGLQFRTKYEKTHSWASSKRVGETCSGFKVLIEKDTDRILGAHILGPHAEEVINIFSLAIRLGLSAKDLKDPILYPIRLTHQMLYICYNQL